MINDTQFLLFGELFVNNQLTFCFPRNKGTPSLRHKTMTKPQEIRFDSKRILLSMRCCPLSQVHPSEMELTEITQRRSKKKIIPRRNKIRSEIDKTEHEKLFRTLGVLSLRVLLAQKGHYTLSMGNQFKSYASRALSRIHTSD